MSGELMVLEIRMLRARDPHVHAVRHRPRRPLVREQHRAGHARLQRAEKRPDARNIVDERHALLGQLLTDQRYDPLQVRAGAHRSDLCPHPVHVPPPDLP